MILCFSSVIKQRTQCMRCTFLSSSALDRFSCVCEAWLSLCWSWEWTWLLISCLRVLAWQRLWSFLIDQSWLNNCNRFDGSGGFCVNCFSPAVLKPFIPRDENESVNVETWKAKKEHGDLWLSFWIFHQYLCVLLDTFLCDNFGVNCAQKHCSALQGKMFQCLWIENSWVFPHCVDSPV